jgi:hypothetical protein
LKTGLRIFNDSLRFDTTGNYDAELIAALKAQGFRYVKYGWETDYEEGHFWFKDTESDKDRIFALKEALKRNMIIGIQHGLGTHIEKLKTENSLKAIISERYLKSCIAGHLNFDECGLDRRRGETGVEYVARIANYYKKHALQVFWQYTPEAEALLNNPQQIADFFEIK